MQTTFIHIGLIICAREKVCTCHVPLFGLNWQYAIYMREVPWRIGVSFCSCHAMHTSPLISILFVILITIFVLLFIPFSLDFVYTSLMHSHTYYFIPHMYHTPIIYILHCQYSLLLHNVPKDIFTILSTNQPPEQTNRHCYCILARRVTPLI